MQVRGARGWGWGSPTAGGGSRSGHHVTAPTRNHGMNCAHTAGRLHTRPPPAAKPPALRLLLARLPGGKPSWTAKLLADPQLLCKKVREEAGELCQTLEEDEGKERAASEAADLFYHAMVLLNKQVRPGAGGVPDGSRGQVRLRLPCWVGSRCCLVAAAPMQQCWCCCVARRCLRHWPAMLAHTCTGPAGSSKPLKQMRAHSATALALPLSCPSLRHSQS